MGQKKKVSRFVSPSIAADYPEHTRIGASMTGMQFHEVEIVCEMNELKEILTSVWFVALARRRADEDKPVKMTIITEDPVSGVYEMSDEERRIAMLAIAGFELGNEERKAIRPLYLRLFVDAGGKLKDGVEVRPPWAPSNIALQNVLEQVAAERRRQDKQWGGASHDDDHGPSEWLGFLKEHRDRAAKTVKDSEAYRHRLVVIAALAVAAIEAHDRSGKR